MKCRGQWRVHEDFHISPQEIKKKATYLRQLSRDSALEIVALATYLPEEKMNQIEGVIQAALIMECPQIRVDVVPECPCVSLNEGIVDWKEARI